MSKADELRTRVWVGWAVLKQWTKDGSALWLFFGVLIGLYLLTYNVPVERLFPEKFKGPAEFADRVRWFGILLEVAAISIIAHGLSRSLAAFDKPRLVRRFFAWVGEVRFVFIRRPPIRASASLKAESGTLVLSGSDAFMWGGSVEDRLAYLLREVKSHHERLQKEIADRKQSQRELRDAIDAEMRERQSADETVSRKLEQESIGDVQLQIAGLGLLVISIFMANASTEAAVLLQLIGLGSTCFF